MSDIDVFSLSKALESSEVNDGEVYQTLQEDIREIQKEALLASQKRQQLLEDLRKSVNKTRSSPDIRSEKRQMNVRLIRDGVASEIESLLWQIGKELQLAKAKKNLTQQCEQIGKRFFDQGKVFVEKKKLLEKIERTITQLRQKEGENQHESVTLQKLVLLCSSLNTDLRRIAADVLTVYEELEDQLQADELEEKKWYEAYMQCLAALDPKEQKETVQANRAKCVNSTPEFRKQLYKSTITSLVKSNPRAAALYHRLVRANARQALLNKDFDPAIRELCHALHLWRDCPQTYWLLATVLSKKGDTNGAFAAQREVLRLTPDHHALRMQIADQWARRGRYDKAILEYEYLLAHNQATPELRETLGKAYFMQSRYSHAIEILAPLHDENPGNPDIQRLLALCHAETDAYHRAIPLLKNVLPYFSQDVRLLLGLAKCYHALDHPNEAIQILRQSLQEGNKEPSLQEMLGTIYLETGETEEAIHLFQAMIPQTRQEQISWGLALGEAYMQNRQWADAVHTYLHTLKTDPNNTTILYQIALALHQSGQDPKAEVALQRIISLDATHIEAWQLLAAVYMDRNEWDKAKQALHHAAPLIKEKRS
ncbi:MAG: tetratricopeptide repeat protein [bacterium]|jgi:tetratricopeptide (TPR) repeat protein|nr:tetratricopeptide repeat protein [bacterium]